MSDEACLDCFKSPCIHLSPCNLHLLLDWWVEVISDLIPGTPRLVSTVRRESAEDDDLRGFSVAKANAPLRLDVLAVLIEIEDGARDLVATVCRALNRKPPVLLEPSPAQFPRRSEVLQRRLAWLLAQLPVINADAELSRQVRKRTGRMAAALRRGVAMHLPTGPLPYSCPECEPEDRLLGDAERGTVTCPACNRGWSHDGTGQDSLLWLGRLLWRFAPVEEELLLTTEAAAAVVGVKPENIRDWQRSGHLEPAERGEGSRPNRYRHADVLAARAATERETA